MSSASQVMKPTDSANGLEPPEGAIVAIGRKK
jgi:hypothetical protein